MKIMKVTKKRNKLWVLQLLAFMLAMVFMVSWGNPMTARADEDGPNVDLDLLDDENYLYGGGGSGGKGIGSRTAKSNNNTYSNIGGSVHGNSLASTATNYGYALVDKNTSTILKFGETLYPKTRYSQSYLDNNNATMKILESGSKATIHMWQYDMNSYYKYKYGIFPPLNKRGW